MPDGSTVTSHIFDRLPATLELTVTAILLGIVISIPLGVTGALRRGSKLHHSLTALSVGGFAVPPLLLRPGLILIFPFQVQRGGVPFFPARRLVPPGHQSRHRLRPPHP